jgi:hypothetical protein
MRQLEARTETAVCADLPIFKSSPNDNHQMKKSLELMMMKSQGMVGRSASHQVRRQVKLFASLKGFQTNALDVPQFIVQQ